METVQLFVVAKSERVVVFLLPNLLYLNKDYDTNGTSKGESVPALDAAAEM